MTCAQRKLRTMVNAGHAATLRLYTDTLYRLEAAYIDLPIFDMVIPKKQKAQPQ
jgi:hypothetical protein